MFVETARNTITRLARSGLTPAAIAVALELAPSTVDYHLSRLRREPVADIARGAGAIGSNDQESRGDAASGAASARSRITTREEVAKRLQAGVARTEIARALGITKATVSYHARRLGAPIDERCARRYDWVAVQRHYDAGHTVRECMATFGFVSKTWFSAVSRGAIIPRPSSTPIAELCVAGTYRGRFNLKARLLRAGLKDGRCERCGLVDWRGKPITLALHHVNGVRNDNRLENLQLLRPNCHSQTDTYAGRNGGRRGVT
jgi:DNA-binding CsgD family transcriptional regulator